MMKKILNQLIRVEHKEWAKLHKIHIGVSGLTFVLGAGVVTIVLSHGSNVQAIKPSTASKAPSLISTTVGSAEHINGQISADTNSPTNVTKSTNVSNSPQTTSSSVHSPATPETQTITSNQPSTSSPQPSTNVTSSPPTRTISAPINTYPTKWAQPMIDSLIDDWGMQNRESTSYTAWKVYEAFGKMPMWGSAPPCQNGLTGGDAGCWPTDAQASGISTGATPHKGSVGIVAASTVNGSNKYGFSAWIEDVDSSTGTVTYSAYNCYPTGQFCHATVNASYFNTYIYFGQ